MLLSSSLPYVFPPPNISFLLEKYTMTFDLMLFLWDVHILHHLPQTPRPLTSEGLHVLASGIGFQAFDVCPFDL